MNRFKAILILISLSHLCFAQGKNGFSYLRPVEGIQQKGWHTFPLPAEIFAHTDEDLSDLRLLRIESGDTTEVPYLLKKRTTTITQKEVQLRPMNQSKKDGVLFVTFAPGDQEVNYLDLQFTENNFFARVSVEGGEDKKEWFEIVSDQRIFSIDTPNDKLALTSVDFPEADYAFLRVSVHSDKPLAFNGASFRYQTISEGAFKEITASWNQADDKKSKQSIIDITLDHFQPVSELKVIVSEELDYYRTAALYFVRDSTLTEKGWIKNYQHLRSDYLTSFKPNEFFTGYTLAREFRLVVNNGDNVPLKIDGVSLKAPVVELIAKLEPGSHFLFYGNKHMATPSYDLAYFEEKIPDQLAIATLGTEKDITEKDAPGSALFENKVWLWLILIAIISLLGFFTLRMMSGKPSAT